MGRPLQPNAAGGPPSVPQALNRYAATPLGQPGVAQAAHADGANLTPLALGVGFAKNSAVELAKQAVEQNTKPGIIAFRAQATARIWLELGEDMAFPPYADDVIRSFQGVVKNRGMLWITVEAASELGLYGSADEFAKGMARALPDIEAASVRGLVTGSIRRIPVRGQVPARGVYNALTVLGPLADIGIGAGFQYWTDYRNPYLTKGQKLGRAVISGVSEGLGAVILTAAVCSSTGGVGCVVIAGVSGGFAGGAFARSLVFPFFDLQPQRHLQALVQ